MTDEVPQFVKIIKKNSKAFSSHPFSRCIIINIFFTKPLNFYIDHHHHQILFSYFLIIFSCAIRKLKDGNNSRMR